MRVPTADHYAETSVYDLLNAAGRGYLGLDRRLLGAILDRGEAAIPDLLRFGLEDRDDDPVDLTWDLVALFRRLRTPAALPFYVDCLRRSTEDTTDELVEAIIPLGAAAVEPLLRLYAELGEERGGEVAFVLAALRVRDPRILGLLLERLEFDAADAAGSLGLYGDRAAIPALASLLAETGDDDEFLRRELRFALESISTGLHAGTPEFPEPDVLSGYPEKAPPCLFSLPEEERLELLLNSSAELRAAAAESFFNEDFDQDTVSRLLALARNDPESEVRARAWESLADATEDPAIRDAMLARLRQPDLTAIESGGLIVGLHQLTDHTEVHRAVLRLHQDPLTRTKALEAMWRSLDRRYAKFFPQHLDSDDPELRHQAIVGTGFLGIHSEAARLRSFFDDDDVRLDALFAYALCVPSDVSPARMRALFRKIDQAAGGLSAAEAALVEAGLDQRLGLHGLPPVFHRDEEPEEKAEEETPAPPAPKPGRNDPCPCGSGRKYKKCCGA